MKDLRAANPDLAELLEREDFRGVLTFLQQLETALWAGAPVSAQPKVLRLLSRR
jgi:hypothetical protein